MWPLLLCQENAFPFAEWLNFPPLHARVVIMLRIPVTQNFWRIFWVFSLCFQHLLRLRSICRKSELGPITGLYYYADLSWTSYGFCRNWAVRNPAGTRLDSLAWLMNKLVPGQWTDCWQVSEMCSGTCSLRLCKGLLLFKVNFSILVVLGNLAIGNVVSN